MGPIRAAANSKSNDVGILIKSSGNSIGGTNANERNVISGNKQVGVQIVGQEAIRNSVTGNYIGLDKTAKNSLPNGRGVHIKNASDNFIGSFISGPVATSGNVIAGNKSDGVLIEGTAGEEQPIQTNFIGTDNSGAKLPFDLSSGVQQFGVRILNAPSNQVGGTIGEGNVISGNKFVGVEISGSTAKTNKVLGNLIGTNAAGTDGVPSLAASSLSNQLVGVRIKSSNNTVANNVVSGNQSFGVLLLELSKPSQPPESTDNKILGNKIGSDISGLGPVRNGTGVSINNASQNKIGGSQTDQGNLISGNREDGIEIAGAPRHGQLDRGQSDRHESQRSDSTAQRT